MNNCEICAILATHNEGRDITLTETKKWRVVLDPNQRFLGKSFITLLDHKSSLSELSSEEWKDFTQLSKNLERAIKLTFQPNHFNWSCLMNIAASKNLPTHVHWHLHPRYNKSIQINDTAFTDTEWYPATSKTDHIVDDETLSKITAKIKKNL